VDPAALRDLLGHARLARAHSYAPYSNFPVGAALLAADGRVFTGTNVENASYGLTTCAERTAVVKAVSEGARDFVAVAIVGPQDDLPCPPCGSCLQILHEVAPGITVVTADRGGAARSELLSALLPAPFAGARLRAPRDGAPCG
jgi:cytidine deaminase